ncbi:MAG: FHA domain-containing protein, partial [Deltaproteobacteria bacterium]|nr:FHA domain-containing protein [Deltaproteobacteria bacterium]
MSGQSMKFKVYENGELKGEQTLFDEVVKIGSAPACHLKLEGTGVGRMHAVVEVDRDGSVHVVDLGSTSGTFVNGKRITRAPLTDGDRLTIGQIEIEVALETTAATKTRSAVVAPAIPGLAQATAPAMAAPAVATPQISASRAFDPELIASLAAVEDPSKQVIEVVAMWNGSVLKVDHLGAKAKQAVEFTVGEEPACDFPIPAEELAGQTKMCLVRIGNDGAAEVTIPAGAAGDLTLTDGQRSDLATLVSSGMAKPSGRVPGAYCMNVTAGARFKVTLGCWTFLVNGVSAARKFAPPAKVDFSKQIFTGFSLGLHVMFFFLIAFVPPSPEGLAMDFSDQNNRFLPYVISATEARQVRPPDWLEREKPKTQDEEGKASTGESGQMGTRDSKKTDNRYAVKGPEHNKNLKLARDMAKEMAKDAGILAFLNNQAAPTSPFGGDIAIGNDPESVLGAMIGNQPGLNFGYGGLAITGTGRGGGGDGLGTIGQGNLDTLGHGCRGYNCGKGSANYGKFTKDLEDRRPKGPGVRIVSGALVKGTLSKAQIRRVVHRNIGQIKHCYEKGLFD